jgi:hypothetical protein
VKEVLVKSETRETGDLAGAKQFSSIVPMGRNIDRKFQMLGHWSAADLSVMKTASMTR